MNQEWDVAVHCGDGLSFVYIRCRLPSGTKSDGAIAQLGERLNGIQEVSGSIPLSSTKLSSQLIMSMIMPTGSRLACKA